MSVGYVPLTLLNVATAVPGLTAGLIVKTPFTEITSGGPIFHLQVCGGTLVRYEVSVTHSPLPMRSVVDGLASLSASVPGPSGAIYDPSGWRWPGVGFTGNAAVDVVGVAFVALADGAGCWPAGGAAVVAG